MTPCEPARFSSSVELARRAAGGDLGPEVWEWLQAGLQRFLQGESLEAALRLDRASRVRQRNQALIAAAALLGNGGSRWALAGRLEAAVLRFETSVAPLLRRDPGYELGEIDTALRRAFAAAGADLPMLRSQRALYELLC